MAKKKRGKAESDHLGRVAELCCIACQRIGYDDTPAEIHHIRTGQGISQRASDYDTIPLCHHHHRTGGYGNAIHAGKAAFESRYGTETELLKEVKRALGY